LEGPLSKAILKGDVRDGMTVNVDLRDGKLAFGGLGAAPGGQAASA
jgi:hypothetical protein